MRSVLRRGLTPSAANTGRRVASSAALGGGNSTAVMRRSVLTTGLCSLTSSSSPSQMMLAEQLRFNGTANGGSGDINPEEISFVEEVGEGDASSSSSAGTDGASSSTARASHSFTDIVAVDTFSRARVVNFVKRYTASSKGTPSGGAGMMGGSASGAAGEGQLFNVQQIRNNDAANGSEDDLIFHASITLPFPAEYGLVQGEGVANTPKDAELLAAMHAEYLIDAFGFQIYTLSSMQKKHAEAARKAGRWAPLPEEGLRDVASVARPNPLRRVVNRDESEGQKFDLVDGRPLAFFHHKHTMLSPAILDPSALIRIKNWYALLNASFDAALSFVECPSIDRNDSMFYEAFLNLQPLSTQINNANGAHTFVACGKGIDKNIALILAAMHAEMVIDAYGGQLFPGDTNTQSIHAKMARSYGRQAVLADEPTPAFDSVVMPKPLKLLIQTNRSRFCARNAEEDFVQKNIMLAEGITAFTNVEPKQMDGMAQYYLSQYLQSSGAHYPRQKNPYLREKVGTHWRVTVVLPMPSSYGIRGGVGIAESEFDAEKLAAMHAIETLVHFSIPISNDPAVQKEFVAKRLAEGRTVPVGSADTIDKSAASPPGLRRVASSAMPRPQAAEGGPAADGTASSAPPAESVEDACDPIPHRATTPKSYWNLDPDTSDGFILVKQHGDASEPPAKLFGHTLSCVRRIDPMAKNRIINYLAFLGKRPSNTFSFQKLPPGRDGYPVHRCIIRLPVPAEVGDRLAVGEGPELREAEILACMHSELILDNLGIPLYPDPNQQLKHATAVTSVGRFAPFPGDPLQAKSTPSPPPLRMVKDATAKAPSKNGRVNPYSEAGKAKAAKEAAEAQAVKEQVAAAARRLGSTAEPIVIADVDIDQNSRQRVNNYFRRNVKVLPEPATSFEVKGSTSIHQAKLWVPVPTRFGERYAIGIAEKKKDADALCYMHAERIIDALGLHLFNLPGLQKRHVERVKKEGRSAPMPNELTNVSSDHPSPPPLRFGSSQAAVVKSSCPIPSEMALQDFTAWGVFVGECEEFIDIATRKYENDCYDRDQVPLTGDPFVDSALADIHDLTTDIHAKSILTNYLTMTNQPYPSLWRSRAVGNINNRKCLTMVEVPGHRHLVALGVSSSKEVSQRRAAMHMLALFKRLDPTFHATMAQDITASMPTKGDGSIVDSRGRALSSKQLAQRESIVGSWDSTANAFTNDGKVRIIELFTVCNGLAPPYVHQKQRTEGGYTVSTTFVEVTDEDGMKHVGHAEDNGPRRNESAAYNDLFVNMSRTVPSFQSLMQLIRTHPHLSPEQIVDLSLPKDIAERIERLVENIDEDTIADAAMPQVSVDVTTEKLVNQADLTSSPAARQLRSTDLQRQMKEKEENKEYIEKFKTRRETLSIWEKREEIMDIISKNQVTVVCGTTGCGKTTQLPQYILDWETANGTGGDCNIVVTQPRRISATSISHRIADERLESIGDNVGYTIRLDSIPGKHINFCTSGVLLRIFQAKPDLAGIRYIIIDEIHERDINSDFLLILMRELLPKRPDLRLILMSATLQSELFSGFFGRAPVVNVEGYVYPVQELYLEDLARIATEKNEGALIPTFKEFGEQQMLMAPEGESNAKFRARGGAGSGASKGPRPRYGFLEAHTEIDYLAVEYAIKHIAAYNDMHQSSILVFLPGWDEIVRCRDVLEKNPKYHLLLMHSSVNTEDQMQCFKPAPENKIKIILSTNIAESGVTIDDIRGVIDVGRAKEKSFVLRKGRTAVGKNDMGTLSQLVTVFASRANCIQRRGRAGRTRPGMCIRLYTKEHFETVADFQTPEMLRQPLDSLCLQILALNLGDPSAFLNKALEPPSAEAIETSMKRLEALGATTPTRQLTHLGLALSRLPVAPRTGKVILLGCIFKCLDTALTIASTVENEVFNASRDSRESTKINREHMTFSSLSDHMASVNGFNSWSAKIAENTDMSELMGFVSEHSLFIPALRNVSRYKKQFVDILAASGFIEEKPPKYQVFADESHHSQYATDLGLVKSVIAAGLFPNVVMFRGKRALRGKHDNNIAVTNNSVIFRTPIEDIKNPFFVYEELMRTSDANSRIQCRGLTSVSLWSVLLLGANNAQLAYRDDLNLGLIDEWLVFRANFTDLDLIKRFKALLSKSIVKKLTDPRDYDNNATLDVLRDIVRDLVNSPLRPNNLVEDKWEENGSIVPARASLIDPTVLLEVKPTAIDGETSEEATDGPAAASEAASEAETDKAVASENADGTKTSEATATEVPAPARPADAFVPPPLVERAPGELTGRVREPIPDPTTATAGGSSNSSSAPSETAAAPAAFVPRMTGRRPGRN